MLNRPAYEQLVPLGRLVGALFLLLAVALGAAGWGWFIRRLWGWRVAFAIVTIQVLGDVINLISGDYLRGGVGFTIAGAAPLSSACGRQGTVLTGMKYFEPTVVSSTDRVVLS